MIEWTNPPTEELKNSSVGFVYLIKEVSTGINYVGIKKFWHKKTLPPLKGKKRKRRSIVESDWKTYQTSSPIMQRKLRDNPQNYIKTIVRCCETVTDMKAWEAYIQLDHYVNDEWHLLYNEIINIRTRIRK